MRIIKILVVSVLLLVSCSEEDSNRFDEFTDSSYVEMCEDKSTTVGLSVDDEDGDADSAMAGLLVFGLFLVMF
ncbi:MAG: hypothetical protein K2M94_04055 [Paramuribaculum sp.]|nr:hypothetical protein [Paramuribaculum sp.]